MVDLKYIVIPLALLFFSALMGQLYEGSYTSASSGSFGDSGVSGSVFVNSSESEFVSEDYSVSSGWDFETGVLLFVVAMIAVGALVGIRVVGSGLSEQSVRIIYMSVALFGLWGLLSYFALDVLVSFPLFGWLIYFALTFVYGVGVFQQAGGT